MVLAPLNCPYSFMSYPVARQVICLFVPFKKSDKRERDKRDEVYAASRESCCAENPQNHSALNASF